MMANKTIDNYSALPAPASGDYLLAWDASASATKKIPISALGVDLPGLMAGYSTLPTAAADDTLLIYDTSTATMKKIAAGNLAYNLAAQVAAATALSAPANDDTIPIYDFSAGDVKAVPYSTFTGNVKTNGSAPLTNNWDIGANRAIYGSYWRGRSGAHTWITNYATNLGIVIIDGTAQVGIGTSDFHSRSEKLSVGGGMMVDYDSNATSYIGRAAIGYDGSTSDHAMFAHLDHATATNAALRQSAGGTVFLNGAPGTNVLIGAGNIIYYYANSTTFRPNLNNQYQLGESGARWLAVHTGTLNTDTISSTGNLTIQANGSSRLIYNHLNNTLEPSTDSGQSLGRSGARYSAVWAANGTIQTSDRRLKREIESADLGLTFVRSLHPVRYRWRDIDDGRTHYGLIAQEVEQALLAHGASNFGGHIFDAESDRHSLAYTEFVSPLIRAIQELADRLDMMEAHYGH